MNVFLTGATGLLGNSILQELIATNYEVKALVRRQSALKNHPRATRVTGDLRNVDLFERALKGCDVLIHAGACYSELGRGGSSSLLDTVNVMGTSLLLEAAQRQHIRNIVYVSSAAVLSHPQFGVVDENSPYATAVEDPYFLIKQAAEKKVIDFSAAHPEIRIVLLLPSVMLGPGDVGPTPTGAFVKKLLSGEIKRLLPGYHRIVDVRDVAAAVCASIDHGKSGERFLIGGRRYDMAEIYRAVARGSGRMMPKKRVNPAVLLFVSRVATLISKVSGRPPFLKPYMVKRLQETFTYNSCKAEQELGLRFRPLDETITDTVRWFLSHELESVTP